MSDAANLTIGVDATAVIRATDALNKMADSAAKAGNASDQMVQKMNNLQAAASRVSGASGFGGLGSAANGLLNSFANLERSLFSLKTIMLAFGIEKVISGFKSAIMAVDEFRRVTIGIASTLADASGKTGAELKRVYDENLKYARNTYKALEIEAAKHFASGKELVQAWQILSNKGVVLTSKEDLANLGTVVDKIKLLTQGQVSSIQIAQEMRSMLNGTARQSDALAITLKDKLGPSWRAQMQEALAAGNVLQWVAKQMEGLAIASGDITETLTAQGNTLKTLFTQTMREGLWETYDALSKVMKSINDFAMNNQGQMSQGIAGWSKAFTDGFSSRVDIDSVIKTVENFFNNFPEYNEKMRQLGVFGGTAFTAMKDIASAATNVFSAVVSGWASLPPIIQEYGLIFAIIGGAKARAAMIAAGAAVTAIKNLYDAANQREGVGAQTPEEKERMQDLGALKLKQSELKNAQGTGLSIGGVEIIPKQTGLISRLESEIKGLESKTSVPLDQIYSKKVNDLRTLLDSEEGKRLPSQQREFWGYQLEKYSALLGPNVGPPSLGKTYATGASEGFTDEQSRERKERQIYNAAMGGNTAKSLGLTKYKGAPSAIQERINELVGVGTLEDGRVDTGAIGDLDAKFLNIWNSSTISHDDKMKFYQKNEKDKAMVLSEVEQLRKELNAKATPGAKADINVQSKFDQITGEISKNTNLLAGDKVGAALDAVDQKYDNYYHSLEQLQVGFKGSAEQAAKLRELMDLTKKADENGPEGAARAIEKERIERDKIIQGMAKQQKFLDLFAKYGGEEAKDAAEKNRIETAYQQARQEGLSIAEAEAMKQAELAGYEDKKRIAKDGQMATLSRMLGSEQEALKYEIDALEISKKYTSTKEEQLVIQEKQNRLTAKMNMDVGALVKNGLQDYAVKTYNELADKIGNAIPQALDQFGQAISANLTDAITGAKSLGEAFENMGKTMQKAILQIIIDIGVLYMRMQLLKLLGFETSASLNGVMSAGSGATASGQQKSSTNGMMDSVTNMAGGYAKDKLFSGLGDKFGFSSLSSGVDSFAGTGLFGLGNSTGAAAAGSAEAAAGFVGPPLSAANAGAVSTSGAAAGGMSVLGGAAAGIGLGGSLGSMIWSNGSGTMGAWGGAVGGAALGTAIFPGVGTLVGGLLGGLLGGGLTGSESTVTSKTGDKGITINMLTPGSSKITGWEAMRKVTSGAFGSSSTKHYKNQIEADPEMTRAWNEGMLQVTLSLERAMDQMGMFTDVLDNFTFPIEFDVNSDNMSDAIYNISNAMAEFAITNSGLKDQFDSVRKAGEMYIDEIKRLGEAFGATAVYAEMAGANLTAFAGSDSRVLQAGALSSLADRLGGNDQVQNMFALAAKYNVSAQDQARYKMNFVGREAGATLGKLNAPGVSLQNFWGEYGSAMNRPMDDNERAKWYKAAQMTDQFYQSVIAFETQANNDRIAQLQKENEVLKTNISLLKSTVDVWGRVVDAINKAIDDLKFDKELTNLSPTDLYNASKQKFQNLYALAKGGDSQAAEELASFSKEFLTTSKDYYGASVAYYDDFTMATDSLSQVKTLAQMQYDTAVAQYNAMLTQITQNERSIAELQAANANIVNSANLIADAIARGGASAGHIAAAVAAAGVSQEYYSSGGGGGGGGGGSSQESNAAMDLYNALVAQQSAQVSITQLFGGGVTAPEYDNRAGGGPVIPDGVYMTGEHGPEMITGVGGQVHSTSDTKKMLTEDMVSSVDANTQVTIQGFNQLIAVVSEQSKQIAALTRQIALLTSKPQART